MGDQEEVKIPVLSVFKNGLLLKNIFLNNPRWEPDRRDLEGDGDEEPVLIGRHPDCHIVLDHPSISRFHLEIWARSELQKLSIVDRASVHGTWVSGSRILPNVAVDLKEGDALKLGASTRVCKLRWVPLSCAFEMEKPLPTLPEDGEETTNQMENLNKVLVGGIPSAPPMPESCPLPFETDNQRPAVEELGGKSPSICSDEPVSECVGSPTLDKNVNTDEVQSAGDYKSPLPSEKKGKSASILSRRIKSKSVSSLRIQTGRNRDGSGTRSRAKGLGAANQENNDTVEECKREDALCRVLFESEKENEEESFVSAEENLTTSMSMDYRGHAKQFNALPDDISVLGLREEVLHSEKDTWIVEAPGSSKRDRPISENSMEEEDDEVHDSDKENLTPTVASHCRLRKCLEELKISPLNNITALSVEENVFYSDKENRTPEVPSKTKSKKPIQRDCLQIDDNKKCEGNLTPEVSGSRNPKKPLLRQFLKVDGEEAFPADKENTTPNVSGVKTSKRNLTGSLARIEREIREKRRERIPFQSLLNSPSMCNSPLKPAAKTADAEKTPFQSLVEESPSKNRDPLTDSDALRVMRSDSPLKNGSPLPHFVQNSSLRNGSPVSKTHMSEDAGNKFVSFSPNQGIYDELSNSLSQAVDQVLDKAVRIQKKWNMVVDTGCLLDEESRKALKLLEGLKGTRLYIPNIVIRELDCLRRRESLFRRKSGVASSALRWIEECMAKSNWIHVQHSSETLPVAATPPATPRSQLSDGSEDLAIDPLASMGFSSSTFRSLMEIISPTVEDHILDCALLFKRIKNDGELVLLTDSIILRIKAMAEGLLCETPAEFRQSLVNPYSKRFLWSASSPRGSSWSCEEEAALVSSHCYQFSGVRKKEKGGESMRGLKFILLHNSHYGKTSSVN